ncbi:MAG: metallophosphoesterase [candidate division WOR-3 bacterium]
MNIRKNLFFLCFLVFAPFLFSRAEITIKPYLQNLTDSTIVIRWTTLDSLPGRVEYGFDNNYGQAVEHNDSSIQHELLLTPLMSDTLYHYRAISGADTTQDYTFHTPVLPSKPFRFVVIGDTRTDCSAHQALINRILTIQPPPSFIIQTGDLTESGTDSQYQVYFNIERELLAYSTQFPCIGNHDFNNMSNWFKFFALPNNERWYTFYYGNSVFHCLDNYSPYDTLAPQYEWFLNELLADSANPNIKHIFVFFHDPPYTTNQSHPSNLSIREYLCPLFERFDVRITFQGHIHAYEHSLVNGVHYIISGGGGAPLHYGWDPPQSWTIYRETTYEFVLIDIRGDTIFSQGIKPDGEIFDTFRIIPPQVSMENTSKSIIRDKSLLRVLPTTFISSTQIAFSLSNSGYVELAVYNSLGQKLEVLLKGNLPAHHYQITYKPESIPDGVYFCVLYAPDYTYTLPIIKLR